MASTAASGRTPIWVPIVLGLQLFLTLVIFALSAYLIHGKYFNTLGFDIFLCLLTWLLVIYHFLTIYVSSMQKLRFPYAALSSAALMVVFWLAAMGATAYLRSTFKYSVTIDGCYDDGTAVDSSTCYVSKRDLEKRAAVATQAGLAMISGIAGLSSLVLISYIACLVIEIIAVVNTRKSSSNGAVAPQKQNEAGYEGYRMEAPQQPVHNMPVQQQPQTQTYDHQQPYPNAPQQQQYAQQPYSNSPTPQPYHQPVSPQPSQQYAQQPYSNASTPQPYQGATQQSYQSPISPNPTGTYEQHSHQIATSPPQGSYVQPHVPQGDVHEMPHAVDVQRPYEK